MAGWVFFARGGGGGVWGQFLPLGLGNNGGGGGGGGVHCCGGEKGVMRRSGKGGDVGRRELLTALVGGWEGFQNFTLRDSKLC